MQRAAPPNADRFTPQFRSSGDTGLTIVLDSKVDEAARARVERWRLAIDAAQLAGVRETVPSYTSVLVHYDPLRITQAELIAQINALDADHTAHADAAPRHWRFPICAEGSEFAPDLGSVAEQSGQSREALLDALEATELVVYMLGFAPGQPYLGDLPTRFSVPRRRNPVPSIRAGSVLTATAKLVIYPITNPTGWHVVGHTPVPIFAPSSSDPVLLAPGDRVRFQLISARAHQEITAGLQNGNIDPQKDMLL